MSEGDHYCCDGHVCTEEPKCSQQKYCELVYEEYYGVKHPVPNEPYGVPSPQQVQK